MSDPIKHLRAAVEWSSEGYTLEQGGAETLVIVRHHNAEGQRHVSASAVTGTSEQEAPTKAPAPEDLYAAWIAFTGLLTRELPPGPDKQFLEAVLGSLQLTPELGQLTTSGEESHPEASSPASPRPPADAVPALRD